MAIWLMSVMNLMKDLSALIVIKTMTHLSIGICNQMLVKYILLYAINHGSLKELTKMKSPSLDQELILPIDPMITVLDGMMNILKLSFYMAFQIMPKLQ